MRRRRVEVKVEPREDRAKPGTKLDRDHRLPLGVRVRYAVIMAAILTVAIAAAVAYRNTTRLSTVTSNNATLAHEVARLLQRVATDEHNTCVIQARGLPAGHDLAAALSNLHSLVTLPEPRRPPPAVAVLIAGLNGALTGYLSLEAQQPAGRTC